MIKILIVDDEPNICNAITEYGVNYGYEFTGVSSGIEALSKLQKETFELVILDLMMPQMDGFETCRYIKQQHQIPVIMLSAKTYEDDKLKGFELGIDDYITKPFSMKELMARIKVVLDRNQREVNQHRFLYQGLEVDFDGHQVKIDGTKIEITPKEYDLLVYLIKNKNIAISREKLIEDVWGFDYDRNDRTIDTHVKMLRSNLGQYRNLITTVRSIGYKFEI